MKPKTAIRSWASFPPPAILTTPPDFSRRRGALVLVAVNAQAALRKVAIKADARNFVATLPARSFNTFRIAKAAEPAGSTR